MAFTIDERILRGVGPASQEDSPNINGFCQNKSKLVLIFENSLCLLLFSRIWRSLVSVELKGRDMFESGISVNDTLEEISTSNNTGVITTRPVL